VAESSDGISIEHVAIGNGAFGESDIEGKAASEAASELGKERVSNLWTISRFAAAEIQSHTAAGIARTDDASHYNFASE